MDFYLFSLLLGFAGLALLAMAGLHHGHGGQHGHGHGHGHDVGDVGHHGALPHAGHGHAGSLHAGHSHAGHSHAHHAGHHGHHHGHGHGHDHGAGQAWEIPRRAGGFALSLLSPRGLSSLLLGVGATGLLVDPWLGGPLQAAAALAGALVLELGVIRPMWTLLSGFASPGRTLESALLEEARAVMSFDAQGQGLIAIEMDGQIRQLLGTLRPADRELGLRVKAGDRLLVEEVDAARNRCTVSFLGT